jgi:hypothetical protein
MSKFPRRSRVLLKRPLCELSLGAAARRRSSTTPRSVQVTDSYGGRDEED